MMDQQKIKISITKSDETIKEIEECYEGSISSLVNALKSIKSTTNDYLTTLVNEEINKGKNAKIQSRAKVPAEKFDNDKNEESDVELEEDFIDSQIKQELRIRHGLGSNSTNRTEKRTRPQNENNKRMKH